MASDSPAAPNPTDSQARRLGLALDAIEACLETLRPGVDPDAIARALAAPVRAFDAAAKEALGEDAR